MVVNGWPGQISVLTENLVRPVSRLVNRRRSPERPVQGGYFARNLDALRRCLSYRNADNHSRGLRECAVRIAPTVHSRTPKCPGKDFEEIVHQARVHISTAV